jgi:hypothetical protein
MTDTIRTLEPVSVDDVEIHDGFWGAWREVLRETTIAAVYWWLDETGRIDNFRRAGGELDGTFEGRFYNDSDVYKWVEGACYLLDDDAADDRLRTWVDETVDAIEAAQETDGYLNSYFTLVDPDLKWTNLGIMHELYCAGHLFEAAVAHHTATGSTRLLDVATAFADLIYEEFYVGDREGCPGHEEIELALVRLARATGQERYLDLAVHFVDERGTRPSRFAWELDHVDEIAGQGDVEQVYQDHFTDDAGEYDGSYAQDHAPVRDQETVEGHAVRATYLYAAMTDLAMERGDDELRAACERLWENMTTRRMYVTGGIGSSHENEGFTTDYDLPNDTAYAETCAAIGSVRWTHRMLQLTGEATYADLIERTLYNGFLAGTALDGEHFFYLNPLAVEGTEHPLHDEDPGRYTITRQRGFTTSCCPTNVPRLLGELGRYVYLTHGPGGGTGPDANADTDPDVDAGTTPETVTVALYVNSEAELTVSDTSLVLELRTDYPWEGNVTLDVDPAQPTRVALRFRVPGWWDDLSVRVNGGFVTAPIRDGYAEVVREFSSGDRVELDFDLPIRLLETSPAVRQNRGRVAIQRGPLVYCLEGVDHDHPLSQLSLGEADPERFTVIHRSDLLGGVTTIEGDAHSPADDWEDDLYRPRESLARERVPFTAIPYYAWANREPGPMRVWIRGD